MLDEPAFRARTALAMAIWPSLVRSERMRPTPILDVGHVLSMLADISMVLGQLGLIGLLCSRSLRLQAGNSFDRLDSEMITVEFVEDDHVERRRCCAFFPVTPYMHVVVVRSVIGQPMDHVGIAVIGENHRPLAGEQAVEALVREAMGMLFPRLKRHEIDDIDHT